MAPWRLAVASCGRSTVVRRLESARTRGRSRRPGCHARWWLVVRRSRRASGPDRPTDDPHAPPARHCVRPLPTLRAGRPCVARQHAQRFRCTDARRIRIAFGTTARPRAKRNAPQATQLSCPVFCCMEPDSKRRNRTVVVTHTTIPKLVARLASHVVHARLLTVAVPSEVKHTVRARRPLRRGSAGVSVRGVRPLVSRDIAARFCRSALHVSRV